MPQARLRPDSIKRSSPGFSEEGKRDGPIQALEKIGKQCGGRI